MFHPTVFLPGLLCDSFLWRAQIDALADRVAPLVADLSLDTDVRDMAARVLAAAPDRFTLIALSMGGYVAFEIMRQAPQRVAGLALFATSAAPDSPERAERRRRDIASLSVGRFVGVTNQLLPKLIHPDAVETEVGASVQAMAARVGGDAYVKQQTAILGRPDSRPSLGAITVPTLITVGREDRLTPPSESAAIHEAIAGSRFHMIDRCGHLPAIERPEAVNSLLSDWWPATI